MAVKRALGKGLNALIVSAGTDIDKSDGGIMEIDINKIEPNRGQPRKYFDEDKLNELAESIKEFGIIQPIIVNQEDGYYSIIAGERRWRASRIARLTVIPAIVKNYNEMEALQVALIENLQRQDLNPIEEAGCYKKLIDDFFFSQEEIAAKIGKSRNSISNTVILLNLDERVQQLVIDNKLTPAHARVLLTLKDSEVQYLLGQKAAEQQLTAKETEREISKYLENENKAPEIQPSHKKYNEYIKLESDLKSILGTKVNIIDGKKKGRIEIEYYSPDELDRLLGIFKTINP